MSWQQVCVTAGAVQVVMLQRQGFRVAVVEQRLVEGRTQEWNSGRHKQARYVRPAALCLQWVVRGETMSLHQAHYTYSQIPCMLPLLLILLLPLLLL
jgi:hypothetical protein